MASKRILKELKDLQKDPPTSCSVGRYRAEIKKLQESEAEIKALSVHYAALLLMQFFLLHENEQIFRLNQENGSLKQNLNATNAAPSAARSEISKVSNNGINALKVQRKSCKASRRGKEDR